MHEIINYGERLKTFFDKRLVNGYDEKEVAFLSGFSGVTIRRYVDEEKPISFKALVVFIVTFQLSKDEAIAFLSDMDIYKFNLQSKFNYPYLKIIYNESERDNIAIRYQKQKSDVSPKDYVYLTNKKKKA